MSNFAYGSKTFKFLHQKNFDKSDFTYIESTLNASKFSTFKVSNKSWENKMSKCGISVHFHSVSFSVLFM